MALVASASARRRPVRAGRKSLVRSAPCAVCVARTCTIVSRLLLCLNGKRGGRVFQFLCPFLDPDFKRSERCTVRCNLVLQFAVGMFQRRRRRKAHDIRDEAKQRDRGGRRDQPRGQLQDADIGIDRIPQGDDPHQVRQSAEQDERREQGDQTGMGNLGPLSQDAEQGKWDRRVGEEDEQVRACPQDHQPGLPEKTHTMRHVFAERDTVMHCSILLST